MTHPRIDMPPTFLQSVTRILTGSEHCCEWCYERYLTTHHIDQDAIPCKRCPYCGQYGCPRAKRHWIECPSTTRLIRPHG
ncbi:hypothetical protein G1C97_2304 [Bifidobacterium sp. DSM 109959]|uniref:Uncharacterized protein n=1 Tax=Bifidobacterium olomucense TaxID=2675324 RepID=A0A7Y0HXF9_9BIFI|nr:hypothetical protein [Bifidobacterium sp. DSM 109959]